VLILDRQGAVFAAHRLPSPLKRLKCADLNTDGVDEVVVVTEDNRLVVLGR